jgi:hypothetical protein
MTTQRSRSTTEKRRNHVRLLLIVAERVFPVSAAADVAATGSAAFIPMPVLSCGNILFSLV